MPSGSTFHSPTALYNDCRNQCKRSDRQEWRKWNSISSAHTSRYQERQAPERAGNERCPDRSERSHIANAGADDSTELNVAKPNAATAREPVEPEQRRDANACSNERTFLPLLDQAQRDDRARGAHRYPIEHEPGGDIALRAYHGHASAIAVPSEIGVSWNEPSATSAAPADPRAIATGELMQTKVQRRRATVCKAGSVTTYTAIALQSLIDASGQAPFERVRMSRRCGAKHQEPSCASGIVEPPCVSGCERERLHVVPFPPDSFEIGARLGITAQKLQANCTIHTQRFTIWEAPQDCGRKAYSILKRRGVAREKGNEYIAIRQHQDWPARSRMQSFTSPERVRREQKVTHRHASPVPMRLQDEGWVSLWPMRRARAGARAESTANRSC